MVLDHACHLRHATVTELDIEFVANLVEPDVWGKVFFIRKKNFLPIFVITFMLYGGGLNQVMLLFLGFLRFGEVVECIENVMHGECLAFFKPQRMME